MYAVAALLLASPLPVVAGWSSPDFRVRDAASVLATARYGPARQAWRWADTLASPECQFRADRARAAALAAALRRLGPYPAADAYWYEPGTGYVRPRDWIARSLESALDDLGRDAYPHANYRAATRMRVAGWLSAGIPERLVTPVLDDMRRRDRAYYRTTNQTTPWEK